VREGPSQRGGAPLACETRGPPPRPGARGRHERGLAPIAEAGARPRARLLPCTQGPTAPRRTRRPAPLLPRPPQMRDTLGGRADKITHRRRLPRAIRGDRILTPYADGPALGQALLAATLARAGAPTLRAGAGGAAGGAPDAYEWHLTLPCGNVAVVTNARLVMIVSEAFAALEGELMSGRRKSADGVGPGALKWQLTWDQMLTAELAYHRQVWGRGRRLGVATWIILPVVICLSQRFRLGAAARSMGLRSGARGPGGAARAGLQGERRGRGGCPSGGGRRGVRAARLGVHTGPGNPASREDNPRAPV
jgi:hypothetical protein